MKSILLLLAIYAIYRIYQDSNIYMLYGWNWIIENQTMAIFIIGLLLLYLFTYQVDLLYQVTSIVYDYSTSKDSKIKSAIQYATATGKPKVKRKQKNIIECLR